MASERTSHGSNSCLSLTTLSSVGRWVTWAFCSNLLSSCTLMQGFGNALNHSAFLLPLARKNISLSLTHLLEPEREMRPVAHMGREALLYRAPPLPEDGIT